MFKDTTTNSAISKAAKNYGCVTIYNDRCCVEAHNLAGQPFGLSKNSYSDDGVLWLSSCVSLSSCRSTMSVFVSTHTSSLSSPLLCRLQELYVVGFLVSCVLVV